METLSTHLSGLKPLFAISLFKWMLYGLLGLLCVVALSSLLVVVAAIRLNKRVDDAAASRNEIAVEKGLSDEDSSTKEDSEKHYLY